jgi:N-acyl-L-homoserine lactone synthetase
MSKKSQRLRAVFCTYDSNRYIIHQLFRFRKALFVDALGWDLIVDNGCERDQFDTSSAVYCALFRDDVLVGGFRAISTDHPYLARWVFPQLAMSEPYPQQPDIWEISRFGVLPSEVSSDGVGILYSLVFRWAYTRRASALVAIADARYERFLRSLGIRTRRYGPMQVIGTDTSGRSLVAGAGITRLEEQRGSRFEALLKLADNVEIDDETLVLGPDRLSA